MNPFQIGAILGIKLLRTVATVLAVSLVISSSYVLWDMWHIDKNAFASYDMTKYRPAVEDGEPASLEEAREVNEDIRAWITAYNTHIDYPVAQGKDDLEYVNKDIYGEQTPAGSIYLATENSPDFSDPYNLLYGHHVETGAMFGDVANYAEDGYLGSHPKGILITEEGVYDLDFFACVKTVAYDNVIYNPSRIGSAEEILPYIYEHAVRQRDVRGITKILALSTCDDYATNGRTVVFAKMSPHEGTYEPYSTLNKDDSPLIGMHGDKYWAFLNLICLIVTIYLAVPLHLLKTKYRRKKVMKERDELFSDESGKDAQDARTENRGKGLYGIKTFGKRAKTGSILEILVSAISLIVFIFTENIRLPIQMIDKWTPLMIAFLLLVWILDVRLLRYRRKAKEGKGEDEESEEAVS